MTLDKAIVVDGITEPTVSPAVAALYFWTLAACCWSMVLHGVLDLGHGQHDLPWLMKYEQVGHRQRLECACVLGLLFR